MYKISKVLVSSYSHYLYFFAFEYNLMGLWGKQGIITVRLWNILRICKKKAKKEKKTEE